MGRRIAGMTGLGARGQFAATNRLRDHGCVRRAPGDPDVTDVPFTEAREIGRGDGLIPADQDRRR